MADRMTVKELEEKQVAAFLDAIASGVAPWQKPWHCVGSAFVRNACTGRPYSGMNILWLSLENRPIPLWVTEKQVAQMGGEIIENEESTPVVAFFPFADKKKEAKAKKAGKQYYPRWGSTVHFVYNVEQTTVDPERYARWMPKVIERVAGAPIEECHEFIASFLAGEDRLGYSLGGDKAYYSSANDKVRVPQFESFATPEEFYSTNFHEFAHASGHKSRLARRLGNAFGSPAYAEEELIAEMTAAFVCANFQIDGKCQHESYLGHWYKAVEKDPKIFVRAAGRASRAAKFIRERAEMGAKILAKLEKVEVQLAA